MQLHTIKRKTKRLKKVQIGRGSKRGKTSGRGQKGQTSRAGAKLRPEIREIIKKIPKLRGRGVNSFKSFERRPVVINVGDLQDVKAGTMLSPKSFADLNIIPKYKGKIQAVKVLGDGEINIPLLFKNVSVSAQAKEKIEKAGGKVYDKKEINKNVK